MDIILPYSQSYSIPLVFLSVAIAIIASFTALGTGQRLASATCQYSKAIWIVLGSFSLGLGIWAMHFIGMLALQLPVPVSYDFTTTIISILPAIFSSSIILRAIQPDSACSQRVLTNGVLLGTGIGLMHHLGMAAMRIDATMVHNKWLVVFSICFAIIAASMALCINNKAVQAEQKQGANKRQLLSAGVMGIAVSGMHYSAMAAVSFMPGNGLMPDHGISENELSMVVMLVVLLIIITSVLIPHLLRYKQNTNDLSKLIEDEKRTMARMQSIMDSSQDALVQIDSTGTICGWSKQAELLFGWLKTDALGKPITDIIQLDAFCFDSIISELINDASHAPRGVMESEGLHSEGYQFPVEFTIGISGTDGQREITAFVRNISARKRDEQMLRTLAELGSSAGSVDAFKKIVCQLALSHQMRFAAIASISTKNPEFIETLACWGDGHYFDKTSYKFADSPAEQVIKEDQICFLPQGVATLFPVNSLLKTMQVDSFLGIPVKNRDNQVIALIAILDDKPISPTLRASTILTTLATRIGLELDKQESDKKIELLAHYDELTRLPNRTLFADRFTQAVAHSKRNGTFLAICFLDLDNFKPVNDLYGHGAGDQLLIEVSERITNSIREEDTVSRQGGDEFTLLLGDLYSFHPCEQLLHRILERLAEPYLIDGNEITISASLGVTLFPQDDSGIDTLIRHADQAMYQAKLSGKNRYQLFNPEIEQETNQKHNKLAEIEHALANDQLCLHYQPKVNLETGKVYGVEALIRWQHPKNGLLAPLDFLPIIAETELEIQLGEWVIEQALSQLSLWQAQDLNLEMSVNIASHHLQSSSFTKHLQATLIKQPTIVPEQLQLEILESTALGDIDDIHGIIQFCQENIGVQVALDDFGTGYSSLTHLRNLPIQTIKIDQTFVRNVLDNPDDAAIINGIIGLANSFNRKLIAEGIETTEHGLILLLMGCKYAQGYAIASPMPAEALPPWLHDYSPNEAWLSHKYSGYNQKDRRKQQFSLLITHWVQRLETALVSRPSDLQQWPIMDRHQCPCGSWLKRERHEQLFDGAWFFDVDQVHEQLHSMADSLKILFHQHVFNEAKNGFSSITELLARVDALLLDEHRPKTDLLPFETKAN